MPTSRGRPTHAAAGTTPGIGIIGRSAYWFLCRRRHKVHRIRNILEALPRAERKVCLRGLRAIYRARTRRAAVGAYWRWAKAWRVRPPVLVRHLERDLDDLLERAFRELRRRIRPMGSLADRRSADRILYAQVLRLNELLARRPLPAFTQDT